MWSNLSEQAKAEIEAIRQDAVDLFFFSGNGPDVLLYLLRQFCRWGYPINSPDDATRANVAREIVEFLMGPPDPTVSDERYLEMLKAAVDAEPSPAVKLSQGEGFHDAPRRRRKQ